MIGWLALDAVAVEELPAAMEAGMKSCLALGSFRRRLRVFVEVVKD